VAAAVVAAGLASGTGRKEILMLPLAFAVTWAGYGLTSWGYGLVKGWNIGFGAWFNPVHPWEWTAETAASPPLIPPTQVNPSSQVKPVTTPAQAA
jgi:hypothetical protein